jgi:hypothetical protein
MHSQTPQQVSEPKKEKMDFEITLSGTYWGDRNPYFHIAVDDQILVDSRILAAPSSKGLPGSDYMTAERELGTYQVEKFSIDLTPGTHVLAIALKNKLPTDTCGFDAQGQYSRDVLLNIERVKIDGMDLQNLIHEESEYQLDFPAVINGEPVTTLHRCVHLGFNGSYKLNFSTPFYIWLLERL